MQPARDQTHKTEELHLVFLASPVSIRENLAHLMQARPLSDLSDDSRGSAELVLAEVLNNVAEHAYPEGQGPVSISLVRAAAGISCLIVDQGAPMPGGALPPGVPPPAPDLALDDLPEGGFGWLLIRSLTHDLAYLRTGGCNRLSFTLPT
jgi:serine/threonine-protein kinase RsbW